MKIDSLNNKPENRVPNIGIKKLKNDKNPTELYLINVFHKLNAIAVIMIIYPMIRYPYKPIDVNGVFSP